MSEMENYEQDEVFDPAYQAHKLRVEGKTWPVVAQETGYSSAAAASTAVNAYLQTAKIRLSEQRRSQALELELDRLEALHEKFWPAAMQLDDKAANMVLRVMAQRAKFLGLEVVDDKETAGSKTILVMGSNKDYVEKLQEIASGKYNSDEEEDD